MKKKILLTLIPVSVALLSPISVMAEDFPVRLNPLHYAVTKNDVEYVHNLIKEDPKLATHFNKDGLTPLNIAIIENNLSSLKKILELNISPNIKNSKNETPLVYAIKNDKYEAAKILIEKGASKKIKDDNNLSAEDYAKQEKYKSFKGLFFPVKITGDILKSSVAVDRDGIQQEGINKLLKQQKENDIGNKKRDEEIIILINSIGDSSKIRYSLIKDEMKILSNNLELLKLENKELEDTLDNRTRENMVLIDKVKEFELKLSRLEVESDKMKQYRSLMMYSQPMVQQPQVEKEPILNLNKVSEEININEDEREPFLIKVDGVIIDEDQETESINTLKNILEN